MANFPDHFNIPHKKNIWSYTETIFEICLMVTPILLIFWDAKNPLAALIIALPLFIWSIIPSLLEWIFLLSSAPILTLTQKGVYFYYPFQIGFINWTDFKAIATQKVHWKQYYRVTFQNTEDITSHWPLFKRLLFYRIYRKNDLLIPQDILSCSQKEFFQAIQQYSNVAPDNVDV